MRGVDVADFKSGALAAQTALAESRKTALVGELGERIYLVHELRQLISREEVADDSRHDLRVYEARRR